MQIQEAAKSTTRESMSFATACKTHFGLKPNQGFAEFVGELKQLTPQDKADLAPMLSNVLDRNVTV